MKGFVYMPITNHAKFAENAQGNEVMAVVPKYHMTEAEFDSVVHRAAATYGDRITWESKGVNDIHNPATFHGFKISYEHHTGLQMKELAEANHDEAVIIINPRNTGKMYKIAKAVLSRIGDVDPNAWAESGMWCTPARQGFDRSVDSALRTLARSFFT